MSDYELGFIVGASVAVLVLGTIAYGWYVFWPFDPDGIKAYRKRQRIAKRREVYR